MSTNTPDEPTQTTQDANQSDPEDIPLTETQQLVEDLSLVTKLALQLPSFVSADLDRSKTTKGNTVIIVELSREMPDHLNPEKMADPEKDKEKLLEKLKLLESIGIRCEIVIVE